VPVFSLVSVAQLMAGGRTLIRVVTHLENLEKSGIQEWSAKSQGK